MALTNELNGTIEEATGGTLAVNIGPATVVNDGLMEAATGTLTLRSTVDDTGGGIPVGGVIRRHPAGRDDGTRRHH